MISILVYLQFITHIWILALVAALSWTSIYYPVDEVLAPWTFSSWPWSIWPWYCKLWPRTWSLCIIQTYILFMFQPTKGSKDPRKERAKREEAERKSREEGIICCFVFTFLPCLPVAAVFIIYIAYLIAMNYLLWPLSFKSKEQHWLNGKGTGFSPEESRFGSCFHTSHWWLQGGYLGKITAVHQNIPNVVTSSDVNKTKFLRPRPRPKTLLTRPRPRPK